MSEEKLARALRKVLKACTHLYNESEECSTPDHSWARVAPLDPWENLDEVMEEATLVLKKRSINRRRMQHER